jgi:cobalt/nickel transport system permease protein
MKFNKIEKAILCVAGVFAAFLALPMSASAMHIMEGYLPVGHFIVWSVVCIPFLVFGIIRLRHVVREHKRALILLAMSGAFVFVISSLKIPSVTGSCSHMTGTGLSAILFGVGPTIILGVIVLIFQAILLAHGGLTTLGANTFSMAVAGPFLTWMLFKVGKKLKLNMMANVLIAVTLGSLFTYVITALQLAIAHPSEIGGIGASAAQFLAVFAPTQIPLSVVEALLTVLVIIAMEKVASRELADISFMGRQYSYESK